MQRWVWIGLALAVLLIGGGIATGIIFGYPNHDYEVGRVVTTSSGETIVLHGGGPRFFPGFFLFPLFLFLIVGLLFATFGRRRWGGPDAWAGPGNAVSGAAPLWLEEWHRRAHERNASTSSGAHGGATEAGPSEPINPANPPERPSF